MFLHIIKKQLQIDLKQKEFLIWCVFFPIILASFFYMGFGKLNSSDSLDKINVAVIDDSSSPHVTEALKNIDLLNIKDYTKDEALQKLKDSDIYGIINIDKKEISLTIEENGIEASALKSILDSIQQKTNTITNIYMVNKGNVTVDITSLASENQSYIQEHNTDSTKANNLTLYFFALIAMTILMSSTTALESVSATLICTTTTGARVNIAPVKKLSVFMGQLCATLISQFASCILVLFYIKYVLKYDIGTISAKLLLFCLVCVFTSVCLGLFIAIAFNFKTTLKSSISTSFTLLSCGFAGLFILNIKFAIEGKIPAFKYFNIATLISDGFNSLYYYNSNSMYISRLCIMSAIGITLFVASLIILRRKKYASI